MTYKNILKSFIIFLSTIIIFNTINTILYYNNILNSNTVQILEILSLAATTIITSFYIGLKSKNKGYINGIIAGSTISIISIVTGLILKEKITILSIITYILIILLATFSSILGINKKK